MTSFTQRTGSTAGPYSPQEHTNCLAIFGSASGNRGWRQCMGGCKSVIMIHACQAPVGYCLALRIRSSSSSRMICCSMQLCHSGRSCGCCSGSQRSLRRLLQRVTAVMQRAIGKARQSHLNVHWDLHQLVFKERCPGVISGSVFTRVATGICLHQFQNVLQQTLDSCVQRVIAGKPLGVACRSCRALECKRVTQDGGK